MAHLFCQVFRVLVAQILVLDIQFFRINIYLFLAVCQNACLIFQTIKNL